MRMTSKVVLGEAGYLLPDSLGKKRREEGESLERRGGETLTGGGVVRREFAER